MNFAAVIFDLDGTVLDNEDEYGASFKKVLESLGAKDVPDYPHVRGIGVKENWPGLLEKYKIKTPKSPEELAHLTQEEYLKNIDSVSPKEGLVDFIGSLEKEGIKTALATSNDWRIVEEVFEKLKLDRFFDAVVTAEEVRFKKPDPDLFLAAADKLGVEPKQCLAIEDAVSGIEAAKKAGMKVWGIAGDNGRAEELKGADMVFFGYNELIKNG
jgi:HAD superfamily hydrolase (TIGR01509 family)